MAEEKPSYEELAQAVRLQHDLLKSVYNHFEGTTWPWMPSANAEYVYPYVKAAVEDLAALRAVL